MALETMSQTLARLSAAGFGDDLVVADGRLRSAATGVDLDPATLLAVEIARFEGESDPADEAIVVAVATRAGEPLGTLTMPYGPGASEDEARVLSHLHRVVVGEQELAVAHDSHDHIAAVFGSRSDAESAVADLREIGLGSEHLGVAVHSRDRVVFEDDEERDLAHDIGTGVGKGAVIGFFGGMLLFAIALPGVGTLGVGGLVALGAGSVMGGVTIGGTLGIGAAEEEWDSHVLLRNYPLGENEVMVVACGHEHESLVRNAMARHGGRPVPSPE